MSTVRCPIALHSKTSGKSPAVLTPDRVWSYQTLDDKVGRLAAYLKSLGVLKGHRVGLYAISRSRSIPLLFALFRIGAVACPLSRRLPSKSVSQHLERLNSRWLITNPASLPNTFPEQVTVVDIKRLDGALEHSPSHSPSASSTLALSQPATVVFTSGSSGVPKAALHSYGNHYYSARGSNQNIALAPGDQWLLSLPLYHVGGLAILFRCLLAGATVTVPSDEWSISKALQQYSVTHVSMVATQLRRLLRSTAAPPSLKAVLLGGSSMPAALVDAAYQRQLPIHVSYGSTEMASQITTTPAGAPRAKLRTSGQLLAHRQLKIADDGEILVRGKTLFQGYILQNRLDKSRSSSGWFHTRDVGRLDKKGFLHVVGRKDNMFISGGENIHPEEVETKLEQLDAVDEAVVVPIPDQEYGCRPAAVIRWQQQPLTLQQIRARLTGQIARFKRPAAVLNWPENSPAAGLKIDRAELTRIARQQILNQ